MAGTIAAATATAMQNPASNEGGAMMGFMGMYIWLKHKVETY